MTLEWLKWQAIVKRGPAHPMGPDGDRECVTVSRLDGCPVCDEYETALSLYVDSTENIDGVDREVSK